MTDVPPAATTAAADAIHQMHCAAPNCGHPRTHDLRLANAALAAALPHLTPPPECDPNCGHDDFVVECTELIPEGYDGDEAAEAIILRYLKDMSDLGGIIARLTSAYR